MAGEQDNETTVQAGAITPGGGDGGGRADEFLEALDRRNRLMDRLIAYAIQATHPSQWMDMGGKPYPTGPACEAMGRRCGVSWTEVESEREEREDERGPFYLWTYRARFCLPGGRDVIHAEGHCSSRDQFLGTGVPKEQGEQSKQDWEVDEGNIRQAALTNCTNNGITRILGVRNLSWQRLEELLGLKQADVGKVSYEHGAKGGGRGKLEDEKPIPFGRSKGKRLAEAADDDLAWLLGKMKEPASDPKYQGSNDRWVKAIEAEQARRANAKSGVVGSVGHVPTIYDRIRALPEAGGLAEEDLRSLIKEATQKASSGALVEADIEVVRAKLVKEQDINF